MILIPPPTLSIDLGNAGSDFLILMGPSTYAANRPDHRH